MYTFQPWRWTAGEHGDLNVRSVHDRGRCRAGSRGASSGFRTAEGGPGPTSVVAGQHATSSCCSEEPIRVPGINGKMDEDASTDVIGERLEVRRSFRRADEATVNDEGIKDTVWRDLNHGNR